MTSFSVASRTLPDSRAAGVAVARSALAACPRPNLAFLFCTAKHDARALHAPVREVLGEQCLIVGGSAVGVITNDALSYDGYEVGLAVMHSDSARIDAFIETGLARDEFAVGQKL